MIRHLALTIAVLCSFAFASHGQCQVEFVERMDREFLTRVPEIGTEVTNVSAFNDSAEPFQLNSTRGKHTVLIFGCLT